MSASDHNEAPLARQLGGSAAVAIVAGSMLGVGIFLNPRLVAEQFASPFAFMAMWLLGGLSALAGASAYAQLGKMFPHAGGDYVYLREAFGPAVSAAGGWILVVAVFPGSLATMAVALGEYQLPVLLARVGYDPAASIGLGQTAATLAALALVVALTALNALGAHLSGRTQVWMTVIPVAVLAAISLYALAGGAPPPPAVAVTEASSSAGGFEAFTIAYMAVYFAYSGWNAVGYVGGEVKNPDRNIPLGLLGGTILVTVLYATMCAAFVRTLGMDGVGQTMEAGSAMASALFGPGAVVPVAALIAFAIIGSLNATVLGGARITFAMARDTALPVGLGAVWPKTQTPARALWLQAAIAGILIASGTFEQLLAMTSLAMLVLGVLTVSALFVLRARRRAPASAAKTLLPGIYLVFAGVVIATSVRNGLADLRGSEGVVDQEFFFSLIGLAVFAALFIAFGVRDYARSRTRQA